MCRHALCLISLLGSLAILRGQGVTLPAAAPELNEAGVPPYVVLGQEALGLSSAPVDLHLLPDGRVLAFARGEFAIGDGVRWEVYRQAEDDPHGATTSVAIDRDGAIYLGMPGGIGRVEFDRNGLWHSTKVAATPEIAETRNVIPTAVAMTDGGWFWSWGSGLVIAWQPGEQAREVGRVTALERVFSAGNQIYLSDQATGQLLRLADGHFQPFDHAPARWAAEKLLTCAVPQSDGGVLFGSARMGLLRYDGRRFEPLARQGILAGEHRINDLCAIAGGIVAAAVDNVGIVFLDRTGRIVQSLDRSIDSRLARVKRLAWTPTGGLWALLNQGIARVGFPERFSSMEPLVGTSLAFCQPYRHAGRLWLLADGKTQRAVYDEDGRLVRFEIDTPDSYVGSMAEIGSDWLALAQDGIYRRETNRWVRLFDGPPTAYFRAAPAEANRWLYAAENEVGWMQRQAGGYHLERFPHPDLGHVYGAVTDAEGVFWAELGTGRVARIVPTLPEPTVEILRPTGGNANTWVQLFQLDGQVLANVDDRILRYDPEGHRLVTDDEVVMRIPELAHAVGRPARDGLGRLWVARPDRVTIVGKSSATDVSPPDGMRPLYFTPESNGVVWMNEPMRLTRYDPALPEPALPSLRPLITRVELPTSGHVFVPEGGRLPNLPSTSSALVVHYLLAPAPLERVVSFEVELSGAAKGWIPTGSTGFIAFHQLGPGQYQLRVRARVGSQVGEPTSLSFRILAPWYRTRLAILSFALGGTVSALIAVWLYVFLTRRERHRLERLVASRTRELKEQVEATTEKSEALQRSEQKYREIFNATSDALLIHDASGSILEVNQRMCDLAGCTHDEALALPAETLLGGATPESRTDVSAILRRGLDGTPQVFEWPVRRRTGETCWVEVALRASEIAGQKRVTASIRDITERKRAEAEREKLQTQLTQAQKLESVGRLAGGVAHDFNNMLQVILGNTSLILEDLPADSPLREQLEEVRKSAQRSSELTRQMLAFARKQTIQPRVLDLNATIAGMLKMLHRLIGENIHLEWAPGDGIWPVRLDPSQVDQIMVNLCVNSRDAIAGTGRIAIATHNVVLAPDDVRGFSDCTPGAHVAIEVTDSGCGMDAKTVAHIFEPFFTTKEAGKGTGLGLATVFGIVVQNRGIVKVDTEPGRGATFTVCLPRYEGRPAIAASAAPFQTSASARCGGETVLLVEDEQQVLQMTQRILRHYGYTVLIASSPDAALELVARQTQPIDLLITDVVMPKMNGLELHQKLRQRLPQLRCLFLSGYSMDALAKAEALPEDMQLLQKPFSVEDLTRAVRTACER